MTIYFFKFPLEDSLGGAEFHTLFLASYFKKGGMAVRLFTSDHKLFRLFEKGGLPRKRIFIGWEPTSLKSLFLWPLTRFLARIKFQNMLRQAKPSENVFFFQSLTEKLALTPQALAFGFKVFWLEHKVPGRWLTDNPLLFQYRKLAKSVRLVTPSNFAKKEFEKLQIPEKNIDVIYHQVKPAADQLLATSYYTLGLLSRLDPEKGTFNFIKIICSALKNHPKWRIILAGEGRDEEKIKKLVKNEGVEDQVRLVGFLHDLESFFAHISVFIYPTLAPEAFGLAVIEAQARGIPVIASRLGALPELIKHRKTGFLVDPKKPEEWQTYLESLENRGLHQKISKNTFAAAQNLSEDKMFQKFYQIILDNQNR